MRWPLITLSLLLAGPAFAAGQVNVSVQPIDQLSDVGRGSFDAERNVKLLQSHFESLASRLRDGQTLDVEVLDVDMAGELKPLRNGTQLRVLRGGADWPMLSLRWTLKDGERTVDSREERISDMSYLMVPLRRADNSPLAYEQRLIDRWFDERFGARSVAAIR